jgi:hypothetical protein
MTVTPGVSYTADGQEVADFNNAQIDNLGHRASINEQFYREQNEEGWSPYEDNEGYYPQQDWDSTTQTNAEQIKSWENFHPVTDGTAEQMVQYWMNKQPMGEQERNFLISAYQTAYERGTMDGDEVDRMCQLIMWKAGEISWDELCQVNPQAVSELLELSGGVAEDFMPESWYEESTDSDESDDDLDLSETGSYLLESFNGQFGDGAYFEMLDWAAYNLTPEQISTYDSAIDTDDPEVMREAIDWLLARYQRYHS